MLSWSKELKEFHLFFILYKVEELHPLFIKLSAVGHLQDVRTIFSTRVITGTFGHLHGSQLIAVFWLILHYGKLLG